MGVYIEDMDIPKSCAECRLVGADGDILFCRSVGYVSEMVHKRHENCPLSEERAADAIEKLMPKTARWEDTYKDGDWHCSNCGAIVEKDEQINHNWYCCYHCGAKMENPFMDTDEHS